MYCKHTYMRVQKCPEGAIAMVFQVHEGPCASLKRQKLDVERVGKGSECGVLLDGFDVRSHPPYCAPCLLHLLLHGKAAYACCFRRCRVHICLHLSLKASTQAWKGFLMSCHMISFDGRLCNH